MLKQSLKELWAASCRLLDQFIGAAWLGFCYAVGAVHGIMVALWLLGVGV